jgi:hypothetical protein
LARVSIGVSVGDTSKIMSSKSSARPEVFETVLVVAVAMIQSFRACAQLIWQPRSRHLICGVGHAIGDLGNWLAVGCLLPQA